MDSLIAFPRRIPLGSMANADWKLTGAWDLELFMDDPIAYFSSDYDFTTIINGLNTLSFLDFQFHTFHERVQLKAIFRPYQEYLTMSAFDVIEGLDCNDP